MNRDGAVPQALAEEILKVLGDANDSTALAALQVARILQLHKARSGFWV